MEMLECIIEAYSELDLKVAIGFDDAIIGIDLSTGRLIYSVNKCMNIIVISGIELQDALQYFEYNVKGVYVGNNTPIWCDDLF